MSTKLNLEIKEKDVLDILGITTYQLRARIKKGIYPSPRTNPFNGRWIFTTPWLDTCLINESELKKAQLRVEKLKEERKRQRERFEKAIIDTLDLEDD